MVGSPSNLTLERIGEQLVMMGQTSPLETEVMNQPTAAFTSPHAQLMRYESANLEFKE